MIALSNSHIYPQVQLAISAFISRWRSFSALWPILLSYPADRRPDRRINHRLNRRPYSRTNHRANRRPDHRIKVSTGG